MNILPLCAGVVTDSQGFFGGIVAFFSKILNVFTGKGYLNFLLNGLQMTLIVSVGAALLGLLLGTIVALVKLSDKQNRAMAPLRWLCELYITVIRGTPMALQLFIMFFVIFQIRNFQIPTAIIAFGINSGAYVAENIRAGILSVDIGQTEAGLSLGLSRRTTMWRIVIPQAIKNVIPAICNELIALIKETSIVSMVGMKDLTAAAKVIGGGDKMASYFEPMLVVAMFYLAIVYLLSFCIRLIERRLRASDKR